MSNFHPPSRQSIAAAVIVLGAAFCLVIGVAAVALLWWPR